MLRSTKENQNEIETKGPKNYLEQRRALANKGLSQKLEESQNYKLFLRGLQSSNVRVIISAENLILEIGVLKIIYLKISINFHLGLYTKNSRLY